MQLLEVRNDIAIIAYNPSENNLIPADFLLITDSNQRVISQIINVQTTQDSKHLAYLKLSLSIDQDDNLSYYSGFVPSKDSNILYISSDEILELIKGSENNIYFGNLSNHPNSVAKLPIDFVMDKVYIQSDRLDNTNIVLKNLISELKINNKKVVIVDFNNNYNLIDDELKVKLGKDFKLPLDINAFNNIYENELNDCSLEDKAVIQSIILELREYLQTLDDKYIPFTVFKDVIESEFSIFPSSGLMLLRNKLWKYSQEQIFAENKIEFDVFNKLLQEHNVLYIDASLVENVWYKFVILNILSKINKNCCFVLSLDDIKADKKFISTIFNTNHITPIVHSSYSNPQREMLKSICNNQILCKAQQNINEQESYITLLNKINLNEFIIFGESSLFIPLVIELQLFDTDTPEKIIQDEIKKDVDDMFTSSKKLVPTDSIIETPYEKDENEDDFQIHELSDFDLDFLDELNASSNLDSIQEVETDIQGEVENKYAVFSPEMPQNIEKKSSNQTVENTEYEISIEQTDTLPELPQEVDIVEELTEESQDEELIVSAENTENIELDVDVENQDVETENQQEQDLLIDGFAQYEDDEDIEDDETEELTESTEEYTNEDNSDKDIDENSTYLEDIINNIEEEENTKKIKAVSEREKLAKEKAPPEINTDISVGKETKLTVYDTAKPQGISPLDVPFKVGDKVYHPKHGKGVIEGFTNYSNKILFCQIEFENVGRRILDPTVAGLEKI